MHSKSRIASSYYNITFFSQIVNTFFCSSGIQSGTRFAAWGADQACKIYLQAVCLDNLTFVCPEMRLLIFFFRRFSSFWRSLMFLPLSDLQAVFCVLSSINTHSWRGAGMVVLWLYIAVSGSFCRTSVQLAPIRGAASEQWWKYVLFWVCCTTALFGFLTAV